ncbi:hypothetical protein M758_UG077600 [Ceratodon purpureus]|nr:hypothetical protein M758_UG077600 [Ceratodon purpureus]
MKISALIRAREKIDEEEFGPDDDLHTIRRACLDLPYHDREIEKEWKYRSNQFKEVQCRKRMKVTDGKTSAEETNQNSEQK